MLTDRARRVHPDFSCHRRQRGCCRGDMFYDSTACRWRSSWPRRVCVRCLLTEIVDSLHDRFRLLTGGTRTAVRRQQTLRASVDWSHALLSEPERDPAAPSWRHSWAASTSTPPMPSAVRGTRERYQILDQLTPARRQVACHRRKLFQSNAIPDAGDGAAVRPGEAGGIREADAVRCRHRDYYTAMAVALDAPMQNDHEQRSRSRSKSKSTISEVHSSGVAKAATSKRR